METRVRLATAVSGVREVRDIEVENRRHLTSAVNGFGYSFIRVHPCSSVASLLFFRQKPYWPQMNTDEHG